jgi:hypothetical protein
MVSEQQHPRLCDAVLELLDRSLAENKLEAIPTELGMPTAMNTM